MADLLVLAHPIAGSNQAPWHHHNCLPIYIMSSKIWGSHISHEMSRQNEAVSKRVDQRKRKRWQINSNKFSFSVIGSGLKTNANSTLNVKEIYSTEKCYTSPLYVSICVNIENPTADVCSAEGSQFLVLVCVHSSNSSLSIGPVIRQRNLPHTKDIR
jgi:hypothetical protein